MLRKNHFYPHLFLIGFIISLFITFSTSAEESNLKTQQGYIKGEFICPLEKMPTQMAHSATIVETKKNDLIAAWFGGKGEHDNSCEIWASENNGSEWSEPKVIANNKSYRNEEDPPETYPCWNPVLFKLKFTGNIILFYKIGPRPYYWWGRYKISSDNGKTWGEPKELPAGIIGPAKNKPIELENGTLLCPTSFETRTKMWNIYVNVLSNPYEKSYKWKWNIIGPLNSSWQFKYNPDGKVQALQPTLLKYKDESIQMLTRTKDGNIYQLWSYDSGKNWTKPRPTKLKNPDSGIDAVTLKDGRQLLVYNDTDGDNEFGESRTPLNVAISKNGEKWKNVIVLENDPKGSFSYPAVIQTKDSLVHIVYTYEDEKMSEQNRKLIKHVVLDPAKF